MNEDSTKCGFVTVLGLPNAGKSTLINTLVGSKISIVSNKVQTTRIRILGIVINNKTQIVLVDTPGIFAPKKMLEKAMVKTAWNALGDADTIIHIVDASERNVLNKNEIIIEKLPEDMPCVLVFNKTDVVKKSDLLALAQGFNDRNDYAATFMVSSLKNHGIDDVCDYLADILPTSPWLFEKDQITDIPMRLMAAEITREKIFKQLHQELPYEIMVNTESWEEFDNGSVKISQVVYVQKESQKGIVVGKGGKRIKQIGEQARKELEELFRQRIHLKIFVKVQENWAERTENYTLMGLDSYS
ncbi:MAG: GTPase Era [Alphaproteobacteria bacterium]|nr:GTPase Era [Alphaproteobacteria bacterium]